MSHTIATRAQWLEARLNLLKEEKDLTHKSDEVARHRQALPWVRIDKPYEFQTDAGKATLADLFQGRSQLVMYHFMFGPDYTGGCPSCSSIADSFNGVAPHLANHDVMFWAIARAPLPQLQAYKRRMGWSFPWASSHGSDFNADFSVYFTEDQQRTGGIEYNYEREAPMKQLQQEKKPEMTTRTNPDGPTTGAEQCGTDVAAYTRERPGMSSFAIEDGVVYHAYSAFARGLDVLWNMYQWLDRAPKGRNEHGPWIRRRDEYSAKQVPVSSCCHA